MVQFLEDFTTTSSVIVVHLYVQATANCTNDTASLNTTDVTTENNTGFFFKILNIHSAFEHVTENLLHARVSDDAPEVEAGDAIGRNEAEEREHEEQTTESNRMCCLLETDL